jgi:N-acetylglucosaminyl-diphospho-decaprenol L-rhamnosyltransferase
MTGTARHGVIGLVTVTYSPGDTLAAMLDSIADATDRDVEIVISDNGSDDGSLELATQRPGVRVLRNSTNLGFGNGANAGMHQLPDDVDPVIIVNPDVVFGHGAIDALIEGLARHPRAGAVGPLITTEDGVIYPSARELPSIGAGIGHAVLGWFWPNNPWTRAYRRDHAEPVERQAGWLSGSCLLVRRQAFDQVGGFDAAYFMYFEDVDLGDRLARAGWQNVYVPEATVVHVGGHATSQLRPEMARVHHASAYRYLASRYPRWWQSPLRLILRAGLFLRGVAAARSEKVAGGAELPITRRIGDC